MNAPSQKAQLNDYFLVGALMNDFTKEELHDLRNCVANYSSQSDHNFGDCCYPVLLKKVDGMIDNYDKPCEHPRLRRLSFTYGSDYDICVDCDFLGQIR